MVKTVMEKRRRNLAKAGERKRQSLGKIVDSTFPPVTY
jgi:hypothetical protein